MVKLNQSDSSLQCSTIEGKFERHALRMRHHWNDHVNVDFLFPLQLSEAHFQSVFSIWHLDEMVNNT